MPVSGSVHRGGLGTRPPEHWMTRGVRGRGSMMMAMAMVKNVARQLEEIDRVRSGWPSPGLWVPHSRHNARWWVRRQNDNIERVDR